MANEKTEFDIDDNPIVAGWLAKYAKDDEEKEILRGALRDALDAGADFNSIDLVGLATETLEDDEAPAPAPPDDPEEAAIEAEIDAEKEEAARRAKWSHGGVLGGKVKEGIALVPELEDWQVDKCLQVECATKRPRKSLVTALQARYEELTGTAHPSATPAEKPKGKKRGVTPKKPAAKSTEEKGDDKATEGKAPAKAAKAPAKKSSSTRWAAPSHAIRVAPDRLVNAWLFPREDANAAAMVRIRNVDDKKNVAIYRVDDAGFPCPAKSKDVTKKQLAALVKAAKATEALTIDKNPAATALLKEKITEAGEEFPPVEAAA